MADTTITYNGKTTTVKTGKTATLPCNKKLMQSDVIVLAGGGVEVSGTKSITSEGKHDVSTYAYVEVQISHYDGNNVTVSAI